MTPIGRGEARDRLRSALCVLAAKIPFAAAMLHRARLSLDDRVRTACVSVGRDGPHVRISPAFLLQITVSEAAGVLAHEVCHLLLLHCSFRPRGPDGRPIAEPDRVALALACEACAIELQGDVLPLPGCPVTPALLGLPPDEDVSERYFRLLKQSERGELDGFELVDDHDPMHASDENAIWPHVLVRHLAAAAMEELGDGAERAMPARLSAHVASIVSGEACELHPAARDTAPATLDWRRELSAHLHRRRDRVETRARPHRRHPELVGIVPGKRLGKTRHRVVSIVDTSGSMTDVLPHIDRFLAAQQADGFDVWVVQVDTEVRSVGPYASGQIRFSGGGGTDLRPAFDHALLAPLAPDVVCVFTDCDGVMGTDTPDGVDLVWCVVPGAAKPPPVGRVITLDVSRGERAW